MNSNLFVKALVPLFCFTSAWLFPTAFAIPPQTLQPAVHAGKRLRKGEVWHLKQSSILLGDYDVDVNAVGLRASCQRSGLVFVAAAPDWKAVCYNERAGNIWRPEKKDFTPAYSMFKSLNIAGMPSVSTLPLVESKKTKVLGFECNTYKTTAKFTSEQKAQLDQRLITSRFPREAEYRAARALLPVPACRLLENIFGMPAYGEMPLFYSYISFGHAVKSVLLTHSCAVVPEPKNWLSVPRQGKLVKNFAELNMDKGAESGIENLFGSN